MTTGRAGARLTSEEGAIVVQVAAFLFVITLMSAFVIDYGVQLLGRNQAQNVVDAAALAGATALAFDNYSDRSPAGPAQTAAVAVAAKNVVWDGHASVDVAANVVCADSYAAGPSAPPKLACVQVTASRDTEHNNPLPTYIARLMGITSSNIHTAAIAEAKDANSTDCLKPLAIPDRWVEQYPASAPWTATSTYDKYDPAPPNDALPPASRDSYTAPDGLGAGTGMKMTDQYGAEVTLRLGSVSSPITTIKPWLYLPVQIPGSQWGADAVRNNTNSCARAPVGIGARLNFASGAMGASAALIAAGLTDLINRDSAASWDGAALRVTGSCADVQPACASMSPRIIALALYDPNDLVTASHPPSAGATSVLVRNFVGFFVESVSGTDVTGRITRHPGQIDSTRLTLYDDSSFLRASLLVQ